MVAIGDGFRRFCADRVHGIFLGCCSSVFIGGTGIGPGTGTGCHIFLPFGGDSVFVERPCRGTFCFCGREKFFLRC